MEVGILEEVKTCLRAGRARTDHHSHPFELCQALWEAVEVVVVVVVVAGDVVAGHRVVVEVWR